MHESEITVLLVDDHSLVRKGFRRMLEDEPDIIVLGEASDGHEAVRAVELLKPRVVVMDFALPSMNGAVATRRIHELRPMTEVLILSMHAEPNYVRACLEAGARGYLLKNAMDLELVSAVRAVAAGEQMLDRRLGKLAAAGYTAAPLHTRARSASADRAREIEQRHRGGSSAEREHGFGASGQHHADAGNSQHRGTGCVRHTHRAGEHRLTRRTFALGALPLAALTAAPPDPGFRLADVTRQAGITFHHNSGAFGAKYLPETLGPGCAFFDYDGDGWLDILLVNGTVWPGARGGNRRERSTLSLYRNNRNGTFTDVTQRAGLAVEMYGMGVAIADYNNDGFADVLITAVGQNRLFRNTGRGTFIDVTEKSGLGGRTGFSTSALWFDYDRDGLLDLFVCNYVQWSPEHDVFCSVDGKNKSYCTPEAYHGSTCWLFRNRGNGTFEDVTAKSGIFDTTSKSLGVALLDYDRDGWPDLFVANDTQPNKLYRNRRDGTFEDVAVKAGVAFSDDGRARAGMGVDVADFDNSGASGIAVTNFDDEMVALFHPRPGGIYEDAAIRAGVGRPSRMRLGFGCAFLDADLDGYPDLAVVNGHIDETVRLIAGNHGYAQPPLLFLNDGKGGFRDVAAQLGGGFAAPKVGRGLAYGDFDRDGDLDLLITTTNGPAYLYRNDVVNGNRSLRFLLQGTKSNRDAVGAMVGVTTPDGTQSRMVKTGSSYLSQSEMAVTFGLAKRDRADRVVIEWPSGAVQEFRNVSAGAYQCVEGKNPAANPR